MGNLTGFTAGLITAGHLVAGLFFLKFWRESGDPLFLAFSGAFWLLALSQTMLVALQLRTEDETWIYLFRLAAFGLIGGAILFKNLRPPRR